MSKPIQFAISTVISCGAVLAVAGGTNPARVCSLLITSFGVFLLIPLIMAATLNLVALSMGAVVVICVVLGRIAMPHRPSGAGDLLRQLSTFGWWVLPAYWAAVGGTVTVRMWGFIAGCFVALVLLLGNTMSMV